MLGEFSVTYGGNHIQIISKQTTSMKVTKSKLSNEYADGVIGVISFTETPRKLKYLFKLIVSWRVRSYLRRKSHSNRLKTKYNPSKLRKQN